MNDQLSSRKLKSEGGGFSSISLIILIITTNEIETNVTVIDSTLEKENLD